MGCSYPSLFFYSNTVAMVCLNAKEKRYKSLVKSGLIKTWASVSARLTCSKDCLDLVSHFIFTSFFNIFVMFLRSSARLGMNLPRKIIFSIKDYNSLMFIGCSNFCMALILLGSILILSLDIMCPSSFPSSSLKRLFLGFKEIQNLMHFSETRLRCLKCSSSDWENTVTTSR
jgi:hypothetical protein